MTDYDKIKHMCELQKALDERILQGEEYPVGQMELALIAEIGELLNEMPSLFKHWKKDPVDNRQNALNELVDVWHFCLSLDMEQWYNDGERVAYRYVQHKRDAQFGLSDCLEQLISEDRCNVMELTERLGFTLDDVYTAYLEKNAVNHKRQEEGY